MYQIPPKITNQPDILTMKDYYKADSRWKIHNINSKEEFVKQYVIKGKFHENVPKDIVDAYTTVEYMLAHSYYWWPMYDEAFLKVLMLLETAVKIRAKSLSIDLKVMNNKNKEFEKKLSKLIDEVCVKLDSDILKAQFHRAREIRNNFVHKDSNSYMGAMGGIKESFYLFINLINELFLTKEQIKICESQQDKIQELLIKLAQPLAILEIDNTRFLVKSFFLVSYHNFKSELLIISGNPVLLNTYDVITKQKLLLPILLVSSNFEIKDNLVYGKIKEGKNFSISRTTDSANLDILKQHQEDLNKLVDDDKKNYEFYSQFQYSWEIEKIIYESLWTD